MPPRPATVTSTVPEPDGAVATREVDEVTVTPVAGLAPKLTVDPESNPVPVTVTAVPPAEEPVNGLIPVTVGASVAADAVAVGHRTMEPTTTSATTTPRDRMLHIRNSSLLQVDSTPTVIAPSSSRRPATDLRGHGTDDEYLRLPRAYLHPACQSDPPGSVTPTVQWHG